MLSNTLTVESHDEGAARGPPSPSSFCDAITQSGVGAGPPEVLSGADNRRLKGLIKGRLFGDTAPPVRIGRYLVMRQLGAGGMGVVYAVYDEELDRRIAVKLLHADAPELNQARLLREAQALAKLSHPNVVTVHEVGTFEGQVYIAMEYVRGQTLQEWLDAEERPWRAVVERFQAAARGLAAAHAAGLVHRDFKPSNVLVGDDGRVRVVDFGLVHASAGELEGSSAASLIQPLASQLVTSLTATGALMGTPAYMSPEQHQGRPTDARSDQFSLCVALYEALYHQLPFLGRTFVELQEAVLAGRVAEPPRDAKVPLWLRRVLLRGLALDPAARWPSIDALILELAADPEARTRARLRAALLVTAVSLVIAGLVWSVQERSEAAALAAASEASARAKKEAAERAQQAAQQERDRAFEEAKAQLAATEAAKLQLAQALGDARDQRALAEEQRRIAEEQRSAAEAQRKIAEEQRREAERQRAEAERQTERTREEARRARDANRLARALGARDEPTTMLALLRETESPAHTPGWVPAAVDTLTKPVSEAILREHRGAVHSATFSPDGQSIATAADDGSVLLWTWRTGEVRRLGAHDGPISAVHFSPDGEQLLTASADGSAGLWSLRGGAHRRLPHGATVRVAAFSPDGRALATGAADGLVRIWPREGDAPPVLLTGHQGPIHDLSFSLDGTQLASAAADGSARIWELPSPGRGRVLGNHRGAVRSVVFAPDGRTIATAGQDTIIRIWSARDEPPRQLIGHEDEVIALTFTDGGRALVSASLDGSARIWPLAGGAPQVLSGHSGRIYRAALAPSGRALVTASQDHSARIWDLDRPKDAPRALIGHREELSDAAWSPDGQHLVTTSRDGQARVWPLRSLGDDTLVLRSRAPLRCAAFAPDGAQLLTCEGDRVVALWSRADPEAQPTRLTHRALILYAAFDPTTPGGARAVVTVTSDGVIHRWSAGVDEPLTSGRGGDARVAALSPTRARLALAGFAEEINLITPRDAAERRLVGHRGVVHALTFSADGHLLASGASDRSARIWSADDGASIAELGPHSGRVTALAFSPDAGRLATASWDKRARIFEIRGGATTVLGEHEGPAWSIAFSPDGVSVVTGADDHKVRVWSADGRGDVIILSGHEGPVRAVAFSPDGRELLSASDDHSARIWSADFDPAALRARLIRASGVCLSARERVALMGESSELAEATAAACAARPARK